MDNLELFDDEPEEPRIWTVSQVNRAVRLLLESRVGSFWLAGEVGQWTRARSGHCYFTLKDDQAQLKAVMWRSDAERFPFDPEEGTRIRVFGTVTLYEARGDYQMRALRITAEDGEGLWRVAMEKLKAVLAAEGLLDPERKRPLPPLPQSIGIVTSTEGAALRDILHGLRSRCPWVRVLVRNARVQGDGAAFQIARAVRALSRTGLVDVMIVGRGGGSIEDLWAFNEEPVARAIAECPVPVISAVGHEIDITIADLVADVRAPTPSSAAALASPDRAAVEARLRQARTRVVTGLRERVRRPGRHLELLGERIPRIMTARIERARSRLAVQAGRIEGLSPLAALSRGFAVPLNSDGRILRSVQGFAKGSEFRLRIRDGSIHARTRTVEPAPAAGTLPPEEAVP